MKVFNTVKKNGLKLNHNKSQFNKSELIFLGHKVIATGIYLDKQKGRSYQKYAVSGK